MTIELATIIIKRLIQISLLFIVFQHPLFSQKSEVGFSMGYGRYLLEDLYRPFVHPFSEYSAHCFDIGLGYYYTPKKAIFSISPGLHYSIKGDNDFRLQYFRFPLGLDVSIGKKLIKFRLSFGNYLSALIAESGFSTDSDFHETKSIFQFGWYGNIGISIQVTQIYCIELLFQRNADITPLYEHFRWSPGGSPYSTFYSGFEGLISVGLKRDLKLVKFERS